MNAAAPARWQKEMTGRFEAFEGKVKAILIDREKAVLEKRAEATKGGLSKEQLTAKSALAIAVEVQKALKSFADEAGIEPAVLAIPEAWEGLHDFEETTKQEISRLRIAIPLAGEQQRLFGRRGEANRLIEDFKDLRKREQEICGSLSSLGREHAGQETVRKRLADTKKTLKEAKTNAPRSRCADAPSSVKPSTTWRTWVRWNRTAGVRSAKAKSPELLQKLRSWVEESLSQRIAAIQNEIESLQKREKQLQSVAEHYDDANKKQEKMLEDQVDGRRKAGMLFEKKLTDQDDPAALLNVEVKRIEDRLNELAKAIRQKQERLDDIAKRLDDVHVIVEILQPERKKEIAQQIQQTPEYQELEEARDAAAAFLGDVEAVKEAVSKVANEEVRDKLAAAGDARLRRFSAN